MEKSLSTIPIHPIKRQPFDKWSLIFGILSFVLGIAISIAVGQLGWLVLLSIPGILVLANTVSKPDLGIALLMFVIFAQVQRVMSEINGLPGPGKPLVGFVILVVLIRFFLYNERPANWLQNSFIFLIYGIFLLLSVVTANNTDTALTEFLDLVQNLVIASMILFIVQNTASLKNVIWSIILAGLLMGFISSFQNITKTYDNSYFGFGGWEYSGYVGRPRMTGPYETPNPYVQVLCIIFILAFDRALHEAKIIWRLIAIVASGFIALAIIFTDSRGGFVNFVFTIFVFFLFNRPNIPTIFTAFAIGILLLQFLPANYTDRLLTLIEANPFSSDSSQITDESFRGRTSENIAAWRMFLDNPVFGVGLENYSQHYLDYSRQIGLDPRREARDPASLYLQLLANQGLLGTLVFIIIITIVFVKLYRSYKLLVHAEFKDEAFLVSALFAAMAGYMFMSIYKNSANTNVFWSLVAVSMAAIQVTESMIRAKNEQLASRSIKRRA
jgi:O-antigen ligase